MHVKTVKSLYICSACLAGLWQWWCITYGKDTILTFVFVVFMGFPFAFASATYELRAHRYSTTDKRFASKGLLILWAGMPLSIATGAIAMAVVSGVLHLFNYKTGHSYFDSVGLFGEACACLTWAACLAAWSRQLRSIQLRQRFLVYVAALFTCVVAAQGLSWLILTGTQKDFYWLFESLAVTTTSAFVLVDVTDNLPRRDKAA